MDPGSTTGCRAEGEGAAELGAAAPHRGDADPRDPGLAEPDPVVDDLDGELTGALLDADDDLLRLGVPQDVGECFQHQEVDRLLHGRRNRVPDRDVDVRGRSTG